MQNTNWTLDCDDFLKIMNTKLGEEFVSIRGPKGSCRGQRLLDMIIYFSVLVHEILIE